MSRSVPSCLRRRLDRLHDEDQDDRSDGCNDDASNRSASPDPNKAEEESSDERADDADHDITQHAETQSPRKFSRQPPRDQADQKKPHEMRELSPFLS